MSQRKSILFCYAHPDDEIGIVSLANRYMREEGAYTTLICTTNGDVGTVEPEHMKGYASIADLRLAEFACATEAAGFNEVIAFGYRDSGMMGTPDNEHPESSWQAPLEVITEKVVEVMRRVRPQVVMTFNTFGAYGHPDHIKINQAAVAAFRQLQSEPEHPEKLYYSAVRAGFSASASRSCASLVVTRASRAETMTWTWWPRWMPPLQPRPR
jgi:LmbE family N-acetylglucosaminyl deacetylase